MSFNDNFTELLQLLILFEHNSSFKKYMLLMNNLEKQTLLCLLFQMSICSSYFFQFIA